MRKEDILKKLRTKAPGQAITIIGRGVKMEYLPDPELSDSPTGAISGELSSYDEDGVKIYEPRKDRVSRVAFVDIELIL